MSQRIADEIENRRGLVLGLTLAELLLLLLFLLLLALSWRISILQSEANSERSKVEELHASIESLAPLVAELKEKGGLDVGSVKRLVAELGRVESLQRELIDLRRLKSELMNENAALKAVSADADNIRAFHDAITASIEIDPRDPPATLARAIEVLRQLGPDITPEKAKSLSEMAASITGKIQTLEGERDKYRRQVDNLMRSGNGLTYPSCWTTPDGQTEYMFDITITDQGLIVSDATPTRANDPQMKLLQPFHRGVLVSEGPFDLATSKIFEWSKSEGCRFYSIVRDGTAPTSKPQYIRLRTLVEAHFYILHRPLSSGASHNRRSPPAKQTSAVPIGGPYVPVPLGERGQ